LIAIPIDRSCFHLFKVEVYFSHLEMSGFLSGGLAWSRGTVSEGWSSLSGAGGRPGEPLTSDGDPVTSPPCEIFNEKVSHRTNCKGIESHALLLYFIIQSYLIDPVGTGITRAEVSVTSYFYFPFQGVARLMYIRL
jgi:hypothetical protein